jgi:hypothetical protein
MKKFSIFIIFVLLLSNLAFAQVKVLKVHGNPAEDSNSKITPGKSDGKIAPGKSIGKTTPGKSNWIITPGKSIGNIKLGMSLAEAAQILGKPDSEKIIERDRKLSWKKKGIYLVFRGAGLFEIRIVKGAIDGQACMTKEGITIKSKIDKVTGALGDNYQTASSRFTGVIDGSSSDKKKTNSSKFYDFLIYKDKGVYFVKLPEQNSVLSIGVLKPGIFPFDIQQN